MELRFSVSVDPIVFAEKVAMDAALLLLMLGARTTVTPFHHQPEAQHLESTVKQKVGWAFGLLRSSSPDGTIDGKTGMRNA